MKESYSRYTIDRNKRLGKYISLEYYGFPKRDNANRLDQKRLNIISKRDIIGDSGIGRLLRRENGVPLSYVGMFVDTTNQHNNHI